MVRICTPIGASFEGRTILSQVMNPVALSLASEIRSSNKKQKLGPELWFIIMMGAAYAGIVKQVGRNCVTMGQRSLALARGTALMRDI